METTLALCRAAHFAGAMLLFGANAFCIALPQIPRAAEKTLRPLSAAAALTSLVTALLWFVLTAANMTGAPAAMTNPDALALVLLHTGFGILWIWRLVMGLVLAVLILVSRIRGPLFVLLSGALLASLALTGHAEIGTGSSGFAHRIADAVHLLGTGLWLGGLAALLAILHARAPDVTLAALRRFSVVATPAVVLVLVTGAANALFIVPDWRGFLGSRYGLLLAAKFAAAAAMVALALLNRLILMPRLAAGDKAAAKHMSLSVTGEIVLGAAVLAIVGFLGVAPP